MTGNWFSSPGNCQPMPSNDGYKLEEVDISSAKGFIPIGALLVYGRLRVKHRG